MAAGVRPGDVIAIYLFNSWEFAVTYHAATLAGAVPTPLNPTYREREVRYQLETSGASVLVTDGPLIQGMNLSGLPKLRRVYATRSAVPGVEEFSSLLAPNSATLPKPADGSDRALGALPFSSGTTGLPKGVMLTHANLVTNAYQVLTPGESGTFTADDVALCVLPLYHIYGLNVVLNPFLLVGGTIVLTPRFEITRALELMVREQATFMPLVPPIVNAFTQAAEAGQFPREHSVRHIKCGAAPLSHELPRRFTALTGIKVRQGYGMTEAAPLTHMGFLEPELYRPDSIGRAATLTDCLILDDSAKPVAPGERGELVMRGPQFMLGYWKAPEATAEAMRPVPGRESEGNWYWSGDVATRDADGFFQIVDRRREMIKYKGFSVAPAEVEAVLLEHPAVRDCGVVGRKDELAGEVPCAFVVLREGQRESAKMGEALADYVSQKLTGYKQPREVRFVASIPRNPSGKILRRELREKI